MLLPGDGDIESSFPLTRESRTALPYDAAYPASNRQIPAYAGMTVGGAVFPLILNLLKDGATARPLILNLLKDGATTYPLYPLILNLLKDGATTRPIILNLLKDGATTGPACGTPLARPS